MTRDTRALIREKLTQFDAGALEPFLSYLKNLVGDRCLAIIGYGSTLSSITRTPTSTPDFYVIVNSYGRFHKKFGHAILNRFLPPNIYHFNVDGKTSKYNVLSLKHLLRDTSPRAIDCYNLGRLSKHVVVAWSADPSLVERMVDAQLSAMTTVARRVYYLLPASFSVEELARASLQISYLADIRVEATDKVDRLYQAEKDFYNTVYGDIANRLFVPEFGLTQSPSGFIKTRLGFGHSFGKLRTQYFVWKSRLRAQLRWPKGIITVEGWADYLIAKVERTQGIRIELTEKEKKYWYIYAWKHFFRLRKKNLIK